MTALILSIFTIVLTAVIALSRVCEIRLRMLDLCIKHGIHRDENGDIVQTIETMRNGEVVNRREDVEKYLVDFDIPFMPLILGKFYTELLFKSRRENSTE